MGNKKKKKKSFINDRSNNIQFIFWYQSMSNLLSRCKFLEGQNKNLLLFVINPSLSHAWLWGRWKPPKLSRFFFFWLHQIIKNLTSAFASLRIDDKLNLPKLICETPLLKNIKHSNTNFCRRLHHSNSSFL